MLDNPGVLFQTLAGEAAMLKALGRIGFVPQTAHVLDVGGSSGGSLMPFFSVRTPCANLTCVDISERAIELGRTRFPGIEFVHADARCLPFESRFDVVFSSSIFFQSTDEEVAMAIGQEMRRVVKPGGFIVTRDWCRQRPGDRTTRAVTRDRLERLVGLPVAFSVPGALVPPIGRAVSRFAPALYFTMRALFPFLIGQRVYVMKA
ncbi:MAG: class I SAM-dependent methyltransferase [Enhydrobacter sp.]|nr:MAG: class I SAM-dependent methyltransferase [Enhydrobacter sp.]